MKERYTPTPDPTFEILIDETISAFYSRETYPRSSEPYNVFQAAEDVVKRYELDPCELFLKISRQTKFLPRDVLLQEYSIDKTLTWGNFCLDIVTEIIGKETKSIFPMIQEEETARYERYDES